MYQYNNKPTISPYNLKQTNKPDPKITKNAKINTEIAQYDTNKNNANKMIQKAQQYKSHPYSLITSLYLHWQEYKIPAVYYHYMLEILSNRGANNSNQYKNNNKNIDNGDKMKSKSYSKKQQMAIINKQIQSLQNNTHYYHRIVNNIEARQKSLEIIKENINIIKHIQTINKNDQNNGLANVSEKVNNCDLDFSGCYNPHIQQNNTYKVQYQDPRSPILSPSLKSLFPITSSQTNEGSPNISINTQYKKLQQLINHILLYRRLTIQTMLLISQWQKQLKQLGYCSSVISFQYHKQDYLAKLVYDTADVLDMYQDVFENNIFFIVKKFHEKSQLAPIYQELKMKNNDNVDGSNKSDMLEKIFRCLSILAQHQSEMLKSRMISKVGQTANRNKNIIKSTDIMKKYQNLNYGHDYIIIKDTQTMKKSKIVVEPKLTKNLQIQNGYQTKQQQNKLKKLKNSIIINPEARLMTIDRTQRKHPVQSPLMSLLNRTKKIPSSHINLLNLKNKINQVYLKSPPSPPGSELTNSRRYSQLIQTSNRMLQNKEKDQADGIKMKRSNSMQAELRQKNAHIQQNYFNSSQTNILMKNRFRQPIQIKSVHWQNNIIIKSQQQQNVQNKLKHNNRDDQLQRNKGLSTIKKLQVLDKINSQLKLKNKSYVQIKENQKKMRDSQPAFNTIKYKNINNTQQNKEQIRTSSIPQDAKYDPQKLTLLFDQKIKSTQVLKYLNEKILKNCQKQPSFEQVQSIAKMILQQKNTITLIRMQYDKQLIAWLAVKFQQKDNITMGRSVYILHVIKFNTTRIRQNIQDRLLKQFTKYGYGLIRNQHKILYEVQIVDVVILPLIKIKYKVDKDADKSQIKQVMKKNVNLLQTRILKYYSYSIQTKYHHYCEYQSQIFKKEYARHQYCQLSYKFRQLAKISIDGKQYIRAKADKIKKINLNAALTHNLNKSNSLSPQNSSSNYNQIYCISGFMNQTDLIISKSMQHIIQYQKQCEQSSKAAQIQRDSSFQNNNISNQVKCDYEYFALKQGKIMKKYVNQENQTIIAQFITIGNNVPQVISVGFTKQEIQTKQKVLVFDAPYCLAVVTKKQGQIKTLVVLQIQ